MILHTSTGITLTWQQHAGHDRGVPFGGWRAEAAFYDDGFADDDACAGQVATEGVLCTRYAVRDGRIRSGLSIAIDTVRADAERLGIQFSGSHGTPCLYYEGDGENPKAPPPQDWRRLLAAEAARIGWTTTAPSRPPIAVPHQPTRREP
jgi:hypothetical protein